MSDSENDNNIVEIIDLADGINSNVLTEFLNHLQQHYVENGNGNGNENEVVHVDNDDDDNDREDNDVDEDENEEGIPQQMNGFQQILNEILHQHQGLEISIADEYITNNANDVPFCKRFIQRYWMKKDETILEEEDIIDKLCENYDVIYTNLVSLFAVPELTNFLMFMTKTENKEKFHATIKKLSVEMVTNNKKEVTISSIIQRQIDKAFTLDANLFKMLYYSLLEACPNFIINVDLLLVSLSGFIALRKYPIHIISTFGHHKMLRELLIKKPTNLAVTQKIFTENKELCDKYQKNMEHHIMYLLQCDFANLVNIYYTIYRISTGNYFYTDVNEFNSKNVYSIHDYDIYTLNMNRLNRFKKRILDIFRDEDIFLDIFRDLNISRYRHTVPDMYIAEACGLKPNEILDFNGRLLWLTLCPKYPPSCVLEALNICNKNGNIKHDDSIENEIKRIYSERIRFEYSIKTQRIRRYYKFKTTDLHAEPQKLSLSKIDMCCICFRNDFTTKETNMVILQNCGHFFCNECITPWLQSKSNCPMCRTTQTKRSRRLIITQDDTKTNIKRKKNKE